MRREKEAQTSISSVFDENSHSFVAPKVKIKKFVFHLPAHFSIFPFSFIFKLFHFCFGFGCGECERRSKSQFLAIIFRREGKSLSILFLATHKSAENLNHSNNFLRCKWGKLWKLAQLRITVCLSDEGKLVETFLARNSHQATVFVTSWFHLIRNIFERAALNVYGRQFIVFITCRTFSIG